MQKQQGHSQLAILGSGHESHLDKPDRKGAGTGSSFTWRNMGDSKEGRKNPKNRINSEPFIA